MKNYVEKIGKVRRHEITLRPDAGALQNKIAGDAGEKVSDGRSNWWFPFTSEFGSEIEGRTLQERRAEFEGARLIRKGVPHVLNHAAGVGLGLPPREGRFYGESHQLV